MQLFLSNRNAIERKNVKEGVAVFAEVIQLYDFITTSFINALLFRVI